jgi:hypothetical protein
MYPFLPTSSLPQTQTTAQLTPLTVETYHTGAGLADPVFGPNTTNAARTYLNGTHPPIRRERGPIFRLGVPFRHQLWALGTRANGDGVWDGDVGDRSRGGGIVVTEEAFGGGLVCEWFSRGGCAAAFFSGLMGLRGIEGMVPRSCARVKLVLEYI